MKTVLFALGWLICASSAHANPLEPDYDSLFETHAAAVRQFETFERLTMSQNIQITRFSDGRVSAFDMSPVGAPACHLGEILDLLTYAKLCEGDFPENAGSILRERADRFSDFYARNLIPVQPQSQIALLFEAYVANRVSNFESNRHVMCPTINKTLAPFLTTLLSQKGEAQFNGLLANDRLPVEKPCRQEN